MGTNYYAIPVDSEELKVKIIKAVVNGKYHEARRLLPQPIHIGKSSAGWRFYFNHNNWSHFEPKQEALENFLKNSEIENEYGEKVEYEDFWKMVYAKQSLMKDEYSFDHFGLTFSNSTDFS